MTERRDPGAYIGQEPEREEEGIPGGEKPGGEKPGDERIAAHDAAPGVPGEPDAPAGEPAERSEFDRLRDAGEATDEGSSNSPRESLGDRPPGSAPTS
jgi:hypothetical protein